MTLSGGGFCHHIFEPWVFSLHTAGTSQLFKNDITSCPANETSRACSSPHPPAPCRDHPCPTSEALWRIGFFCSLPSSLSCLFMSGKIDWGNRAVGGVVLILWRCKMERGSYCTEGEGKHPRRFLTKLKKHGGAGLFQAHGKLSLIHLSAWGSMLTILWKCARSLID